MNELAPYAPALMVVLSVVALLIRYESRLTRLETLHEKDQQPAAKPQSKKRRR